MKSTAKLDSSPICVQRRNATLEQQTTRRNDTGQALLELALVLPFLLLLLIGVVQVGILSYAGIEVANAAQAGAKYGAQNRATAADTAGITTAMQNDAANLTLNAPTIQRWCACEGGTAVSSGGTACSGFSAASCVSPNRVVEWVQVDTSSTINPSFHYPGLPNTFTLQG